MKGNIPEEQQEQESRLIINSAPIMIFYKDKDGKFLRVNKAFAEALQMPEEEFIGKTVFDLYSAKIAEAMTADDQEVLKSGRPKLNIIEQYESASGTRWVQTDKIPIFGKDGSISGLIGFAQDITERKRAEEALIESEKKHRTILEDMQEGYWETDLAGNFTSFNDALCRLVGYSRKEMTGINYRAYTNAEDIDKAYKAFNRVFRTGKPIRNLHYEIIRKDGSKRFAETSVFPRRNDNGEIVGFRGVTHDITERAQMEEALIRSEERYRTILAEIQDAYFEVDIAGNFTFGNESFYRYLGYSPGELIGVNYRVTTAADAADKVYKGFNQVYRTGMPINDLAYKTVRKDGSTGYVEIAVNLIRNEKGEITGFRCVGRDISQRMQMEEALRRSEERYRTILEEMQDGYFEVDLAGNYTFTNEANCRNLGYPREELIGMNYRAYVAAEDVDELYKAFNQVYLTGQPSKAITYKIIQKDGNLGQGEISAFPLRNEKGEIIGFRGIGCDVTERMQMEEALRQSEERYRSILEETQDDYFEVDLSGNYTFANEAMFRHLGYPREELIGMSFRTMHPPEDAETIYRTFNQVYLTGQPSGAVTFRTIRKDGSSGLVEISAFPLRNDKGEIIGFRGLARNLTERMQMIEALRQSEEKYRTLLDDMEEGYYEDDLAGNFTFVNDALCHQLGYTRKELMGMNYKVYTPPEKVKEIFQAYNQVYRTGEPIKSFDRESIHKDGRRLLGEISILPLKNEGGEIIGFHGVSRDITDRMQIEKSLRQSEEKYRNVLEGMEESYYEVDIAGNFTFFNDALCKQLGYTREELMGMNYKVYTPPDKVKEVFQAYNMVYRAGEPTKLFDMEQVRKDGTRIVVENSIFPLRNESGEITGFRGVGRDVTERKQMEEALRQSGEKYRTILEDMRECYFEMDLAGNYTFFNDAQCRTLGYSREELMGMNYRVYVPPEKWGHAFEIYNRIYRTGEPAEMFDVTQIRKDGKQIFVESSAYPIRNEMGETVGFRGVTRDVTERKQMEEALRRSEERYRTVMEEMEEGYYETDLNGNYTFFNDVICKKLGYSREEMMGMNFQAHTEPEDAQKIRDFYNKVYRTGKPLKWFAPPQIRKDGTRVFTEDSVSPARNERGEITGFRGITHDITNRKREEEEKKQLEQRAQLASRLASVGELASGVAHEINNPLTGVIGYAHLLLARKDIPKDMMRDVEIINEGAQRVAGIVKKLLAFARQTRPEQRYVNINELINNTLDLQVYALAANNIKVSLQLGRDLPMTIADPGQLQQVFLNLIMNAQTAMKLSRGKGKLTIKTEHADNTIRISFKDNGPGVAKENLESIFDPFFTTREVGQGTGLGLSVCHGIVTEHKGKIRVESEPGKGATFIVELPVATEDRQMEMSEPVIIEEPKKIAKARILVVDDEPVIRQLVSQVLTEEGHTVETTDNAADALKMVEEKRYRLILLDIKMPGMSGIELYKRFQKIAPSIVKRIVFITGDIMGKSTLDFLDKTKTPYLMKPFEAKQLKTEIKRILARR